MAKKSSPENDEQKLVKALKTVDSALIALRSAHADVFDEFADLVDRRNELIAACRDLVKTRAETTHETAVLGPFRASPVITDEYDLDALEKVLTDAEFETAVRIEYKLRDGNNTRKFLLTLEKTKYPELEHYRKREILRTSVSGPKGMDINELAHE